METKTCYVSTLQPGSFEEEHVGTPFPLLKGVQTLTPGKKTRDRNPRTVTHGCKLPRTITFPRRNTPVHTQHDNSFFFGQ